MSVSAGNHSFEVLDFGVVLISQLRNHRVQLGIETELGLGLMLAQLGLEFLLQGFVRCLELSLVCLFKCKHLLIVLKPLLLKPFLMPGFQLPNLLLSECPFTQHLVLECLDHL